LWLFGPTGSGKSSVAAAIVNTFRERERLGASFFFDRGFPEDNTPATVIQTLASQLAASHPRIGKEIVERMIIHPALPTMPLGIQLNSLSGRC